MKKDAIILTTNVDTKRLVAASKIENYSFESKI